VVNELNHWVRNMLHAVAVVAAHTLRRTPSLEEFGRAFNGRLRALARARGWSDVPLRDLLLKER
jgi:two-component system CheB/CheR fusion protein